MARDHIHARKHLVKRRFLGRAAVVCLVTMLHAPPARSAGPGDGCELLSKQEVAGILGGNIEKAVPWPLAGRFACMFEGDAIEGLDLLVNLIPGPDAQVHYDHDVARSYKPSPVAGLGDKASWTSARQNGTVADGLHVLSGSYAVEISFLGQPKVPPSEADNLAHARALAQRTLANAKRDGL